MGSGNKFTVHNLDGIGLGIWISKFPFALTINISFIRWSIQLGFGKGYDQ